MSVANIKWRQLFLYVALACVTYLSIECLSYIGLMALRLKGLEYDPRPHRLSEEQKTVLETRLAENGILRGHHPILGWSPIPLMHTEEVTINSQGIRAEHDYSKDVPPNVVRVSVFGDSFTFGSDVRNSDTWESQMEAQDSRLQVLNFGVGAYGLDQAYLRYLHEGVHFHPDIVIIGFMSENIYRNLNVFRPFYSSAYPKNIYTKPRFSFENDKLSLYRNPLVSREDYVRFLADDEVVLKEIGRNDYYYQTGYISGQLDLLPSVRLFKIAMRSLKEQLNPVVTRDGTYAANSEAFRLTTRLLEAFYCAALQHESMPVIAIYPDLWDLNRHLHHHLRRYEPLLQYLRKHGLRHLDLLDAFVAYDADVPKDKLTVGRWGHYSPLGNKIVGHYLHDYLIEQGWISRDIIKASIDKARVDGSCASNL
jgi:hypothetical protein